MYQQHCIRETLTSEAGALRVAALMAAESFPSRTAAGRIALPEPLNRGGGRPPRDLGEAIPAAEGVPDRVEAVEGLRLVLVREEGERRRWNGLMAREHPRGAVRHTGAQLRYLIVSAHGTLGGMGFAASALALAARDRWMGWEERTRKRQLHRVVGMSRFLIREGVECRNLASKALGMVLGRLGEDLQQRYGYRPVLVETFVDEGEHAGTSLKATNWIRVGETAGRGRFAASDGKVAVKGIYLYPLVEDWREQLGLVEPEPIQPLGCGEGLDREEWAKNELGGARLGDERLSRRLVRSASVLAEMEIEVGRRSGRRATRQQKAGEKREARLARVGLRWRTVELAPPRNSDFTKEDPVRLNLVHVREDNAPEGVRPLEWFLLTSVGVKSSREAKQVLEWYRLRWRIEDWHRVLKTGCKVEYLGHRSGDRIERAVTIKAVIAWRLMAMTLLGRERPKLPAEVLFSDMEILALKDFAQDRRLSLPDNLGATVVTLAMLGGYLNRNNDPPPGHQKIWEGYVRLATMAETYERLIKLNRTSNLYERLRPG